MIRQTLVVIIAVYATTSSATNVMECGTGKVYEDASQVQVTGCTKSPCNLRRKTTVMIEQRFTPLRDVSTLTTTVWANILGVPLPFIGVNGSDACDQIYNADGSKASCPLVKGREYFYKNSFPIREIYPRVSLVVHWALQEGNDNIACFEVPSRITG